ncbi:MAG: class II fructose-bisphosphate aldolase [bacterium]
MALIKMQDMLRHAYDNRYALGAVDIVSLDFLEAVIAAAEQSRAAIIVSIAEPHFAHYDFELMLPAVEAAARRASIPVAIQLDHGSSLESAVQAIKLGCNGVTVDTSRDDLLSNIESTRAVAEMAHGCGVSVAGEVGYVAGIEGEGQGLHPGEASLTVPSEATAYVERTGVDSLAVSIGTTQGRMKGRAKLDFQRLKQIRQAVDIPLEVHGGSGLSEEQYRKLSSLGVAKINYYTALSDIAAKVMRKQTRETPKGSFTDLKKGVKEAICEEVSRCLRLWGSAGRAAEVLAQCNPWTPLEHILLCKTPEHPREHLEWLTARGSRTLGSIPGVREFLFGEHLPHQSGEYTYLLRLKLSHPKSLPFVTNHADYLSFLNDLHTLFPTVAPQGDFVALS